MTAITPYSWVVYFSVPSSLPVLPVCVCVNQEQAESLCQMLNQYAVSEQAKYIVWEPTW